MYTEVQIGTAYNQTSFEHEEARATMRRLELIGECIHHIARDERPFTHEYETTSPHNGDFYRTSEIIWAKIKPSVRDDNNETYTPLDLPEYEEAFRRLEQASRVVSPLQQNVEIVKRSML